MVATERLICRSAELTNGGSGFRFLVERFSRMEPAFVIRFAGEVRAYLNRCAHVPVELDWNQGAFFDVENRWLICGTHGALYSPLTGACVGGRCNGKGLEPLSVKEIHGCVYLIEAT